MEIDFVYSLTFGCGDGSDSCDFSVELTPNEEKEFKRCKRFRYDLNESEILESAYDRAMSEIIEFEDKNIEELYGEDADTNYSVDLEFYEYDWMEDEWEIEEKEVTETLEELFDEANGNYHDVNEYVRFIDNEHISKFPIKEAKRIAKERGLKDYKYEVEDTFICCGGIEKIK